MNKTIYLGSDHAGFKLKEKVKQWLDKEKIVYEDLGNNKFDINDDYPDYAVKVARKVSKNKSKGILLCGSAEGMCIAANKNKGIRAVNPSNAILARLSREHNDANVICLSGGGTLKPIEGLSFLKTKKLIKIFLNTKFSKAKRHTRRLNKIKRLER
jgi:ribose 5-phosphate isomerase B